MINPKLCFPIPLIAAGMLMLNLIASASDPMAGMDMGGAKTPSKTSSLSVTAVIKPNPPKSGNNKLDLLVTGSDGKPAIGLKLVTTVAMTSMDMGTTHPLFTDAGNGHYVATITFSMAGPWRVIVRNQGNKVAVLNFDADGKTPWKSPKSITAAPDAAGNAPTATSAPMSGQDASMPGMAMGGAKAEGANGNTPPSMAGADTAPPQPSSSQSPNSMPGMDMSSNPGAMSGMKGGSMDMKTAVVPQLKEQGTYTAKGDEDWAAQTGFGHNAPMVGMMNQMMVGGSGMEGMKMAPMKMDFGAQNYTKPDASDNSNTNSNASNSGDMAGMDMSGKSAPKADMSGMPMPPAGKPQGSDTGMAMPVGSGQAAPTLTIEATAAAPKTGDNLLTITIMDAQGKPVTGAKITTSVAMTSMDMGTTHPGVKELGGGKYRATATFTMAGPWRVKVNVAMPGHPIQTKAFDFTAK